MHEHPSFAGTRGWPIRRAEKLKTRPADAELGFGKYFTDHMFVMEFSPDHGWHDARIVPYGPVSLDPAAAVFHYGQALFEGLKAFRGEGGRVQLFRAEQHCRRMAQGAPRLCMPAPDPGLMLDALTQLVRVDRDWVPCSPGTALYLRPTLVATEPFLGVRPSTRFTFFIIMSPVGPYYAEGLNPIRLWAEDRYVRAARGGLGATKAGANYAASLLAAEEAKRRGCAQVLWLDATEHRYIEEAGTMNVFVRIGDELLTPPLEGSILAGVTRSSVLQLARDWGIKAVERPITLQEIIGAGQRGTLRELFGCGTAAVISPVGELAYDDQRIQINGGLVGEVSQQLYDTISGIQSRRLPDPHGWLIPVD